MKSVHLAALLLATSSTTLAEDLKSALKYLKQKVGDVDRKLAIAAAITANRRGGLRLTEGFGDSKHEI